MPANARIQKARALLKDASRAFDDDDTREGSRLMWEASKSAISAVAEQRGWPHETYKDLRQVIYHLDHDGSPSLMEINPLKSYWAKFTAADLYHDYIETPEDEWDYGDEFLTTREDLKYEQKFIWPLIDSLEDEVARYEKSQ